MLGVSWVLGPRYERHVCCARPACLYDLCVMRVPSQGGHHYVSAMVVAFDCVCPFPVGDRFTGAHKLDDDFALTLAEAGLVPQAVLNVSFGDGPVCGLKPNLVD